MSESGQRLYALDNLRAIMMWLGVVLHAGAVYLVVPIQLPWRDEHRTQLADVLLAFIHTFRMPVFFILAGFFMVMLAQSRGVDGMLRNRVQRLALPFVVFWPLLWVACGLAGLAFMNRMQFGHWGLDMSIVPGHVPRGPNTMHLWFLWMLLWFSVGTALLMRLPRHWFRLPAHALGVLARRPWGFAVLALPMMVAGMGYPRGILFPSGFFVPPWTEWLHNTPFFALGLVLYGHREELFGHYRKYWRRYAWAGLLFFIITGAFDRRGVSPAAIAYAYNCASWLWSFAWIGLGLQVLDRRHALLSWLADSAYWVYLLHMPLTILFGLLLYEADLPGLVKMVLNIALTTAVCLVTYQTLVRHTWVSVLLNGKRHPRRVVVAAPAAAAG